MHQENSLTAGKPLEIAQKALIMVHGRGSTAGNVLTLAQHLRVADFALLAPQATHNSWYPQSFLAPPVQNEPWLSSALGIVDDLVIKLGRQGIRNENLYFLGFSQGACLTLEFVARNAAHYGGVIAFTGGLIGDKIYAENYTGTFAGTPIFIGTSDPDFHVPVERVHATTALLKSMGADVTEIIYPNRGHTISQDEINLANKLIFTA